MSALGASAVACPACGAENSAYNPRCARCDQALPALSDLGRTAELSRSGSIEATRDLEASPGSAVDPLAATVVAGASSGRAEGGSPVVRSGKLGRFEVLDVLGKGAMGVVVRARDPALGRDVAIKIIQQEALGVSGAERARERLVREAQAMARLKHPNVVTVYEVDASGDEALVVMEHVEGRTLRDTFAGERRPIAEVLRAYVQAGRGLSEVHRAGLVHRDFKPENVLVGADGRVRVTDFGLVGLAEDGGAGEGLGDVSVSLTRTGGILGTPAYMAPEQHEGRAADARADQFAFAVSLWEALAGERPFAGETYAELRDNVVHGRTRALPRSVPGHVRRALTRALSASREARYPDMDALLADLDREPWTARKKAIAAAAIGLAALAAMGLAGRSKRDLCRGGEARLAGVWDGATKAKMREAFAGTRRPYAEDTFQRVERALDERSRAWVAMYTDSCEATQVRGEQSAALLDLRTACLDRRRSEMGALTALLAKPSDADVLDRAVGAVGSLPPLDACANAEALRAAVPPPADAAARARIADARAKIADARALLAAGKLKEAAPVAVAVAAEAKQLGWLPLEAEAAALLGDAQGDSEVAAAEAALREASVLAARAKDDRLLAEVLIELIYVVGVRRERRAEALGTETAAASAVERAGGDPVLRAKLLSRVSDVHRLEGDKARALSKIKEALALYEGALGPDSAEVAAALETFGNVLGKMGRHEEARGPLLRALETRKKVLGPDHPLVAQTQINIASAFYGRGKLDDAIALNRQALALLERALGPDHLRVALVLANLAVMLADKTHYDEALELDRRSLAIREVKLGPDHPDVAMLLNNMAVIHDEQGKYAEAVADYERALAARERHYGPDHVAVARTLANLGDSLTRQGRYEDGAARLLRAIAIYDKRGEKDAEELASALSWLGDALIRWRKPAEALPPLTRALAIREANVAERDPFHLAETRFALGRALWDSGRDKKRGIDLATKARDAFAEAGDEGKKALAEAKTWLAAHGGR